MAEHPTSPGVTSRLVDLLRRIGREEPAAVGFGRSRSAAARRAPLALVAALPGAAAEAITAAREGGADAALVPLDEGELTLPAPAGGASWPVAGMAETAKLVRPADLDRWGKQGADAIAVRPRTTLAACFSPRRHNLLALVDSHLPFEGLRAAAALPVEGFLLDDAAADGRLSGDDLLWLALASGVLRGPALLCSSRLEREDLETLVGMGVDGIAIRLPSTASAEQVREMVASWRAAIDELDPHLLNEARQHTERRPVVIPFRTVEG